MENDNDNDNDNDNETDNDSSMTMPHPPSMNDSHKVRSESSISTQTVTFAASPKCYTRRTGRHGHHRFMYGALNAPPSMTVTQTIEIKDGNEMDIKQKAHLYTSSTSVTNLGNNNKQKKFFNYQTKGLLTDHVSNSFSTTQTHTLPLIDAYSNQHDQIYNLIHAKTMSHGHATSTEFSQITELSEYPTHPIHSTNRTRTVQFL